MLRGNNHQERMSALGQKRTLQRIGWMSALPPKADIALHRSECPLCAKSGHWNYGISDTVYSARFQTMTPVHEPIGATFFSSFPVIVTDRF